ncbi:hypothetical protein HDU76_006456 [Blyttiomyces sp. JEL0837]|nr:hypothetical protein HDU76_006456 [Blyttiomyces sp. JEL0837]
MIKVSHNLSPRSILLASYIDPDGDVITLDSDMELKEYLNSALSPLRLFVTVVGESDIPIETAAGSTQNNNAGATKETPMESEGTNANANANANPGSSSTSSSSSTNAFDFSAFKSVVEDLANQVGDKPELMEGAQSALKELAGQAQAHFESLMALFFEILQRNQNTGASSSSSRSTNNNNTQSTSSALPHFVPYQSSTALPHFVPYQSSSTSTTDSSPLPHFHPYSNTNSPTNQSHRHHHPHHHNTNTSSRGTGTGPSHRPHGIPTIRTPRLSAPHQSGHQLQYNHQYTWQPFPPGVDSTPLFANVSGSYPNVPGSYPTSSTTATTPKIKMAPRWSTVACDACGSRGFTGVRYRCLGCEDFDLCGGCWGEGEVKRLQGQLDAVKQGGGDADVQMTSVDGEEVHVHNFIKMLHPEDLALRERKEKIDQILGILGGNGGSGLDRGMVGEVLDANEGDVEKVLDILVESGGNATAPSGTATGSGSGSRAANVDVGVSAAGENDDVDSARISSSSRVEIARRSDGEPELLMVDLD